MRKFHLLIAGNLVDGIGGFDVLNPATEAVLAQCPVVDEALLNQAVDAAQAAFPKWAALAIEKRAGLVSQLADALEARSQEFATLLTSEQGKPLGQAMMEVERCVFTLRAFSKMRSERRILRDDRDGMVFEHRTPLGVVAAITPWNFPLILLVNKLAPCLIAGNTLIAKPAPTTPLTTLRLGELCADIFPPGVVNVICDQNELGGILTAHPGVAKVAFTGSTATGRNVMQSAAQGLKRLTLELGGNDAAIVLDDVDVRRTARRIFDGAMANAGQVCVAIKRAYVPEPIYDEFCDELACIARSTIVGDGIHPDTRIGPVQNRAQYARAGEFIDDARANGTIISGGNFISRTGYFVSPTIVRDIDEKSRLVQEEQFGPILPVMKYNDIDDAITRANDTQFGLAGTVWGEDRMFATEVASRLMAGTVWINHHAAIDPMIPFRGIKQSGIGSELGYEGFSEYTQPHIVNISSA